MSLITVHNLGKSFGPADIFSGIDFAIPRGARIGLVGANGIGKTTLLGILMGLDEPSTGTIQRSKNLRMGYLPQEAQFESKHSLWEECLGAFQPLLEKQAQLFRLEKQMAEPEQAPSALEQYSKLQAEFDHFGGYTYENRIRQTLTGLGFSRGEEKRPLTQLSGGQRTRALLARLLLEEPDLLLLDEPTNHLDINAVEWLEDYLQEWEGAVLIVSHDRYFLDRVVKNIWEMTPGIEMYHGNYSAYVQQRTERAARQMEEYEKQREFVEKEEEYIRRNMAGQNTRQAKGRQKRLKRLLQESKIAPPSTQRTMRLKLAASQRSGNLVLRTYGLGVGYADDGKVLFHAPNLVLNRGECAALIGPNGAGKTTFLKTILGKIPPLEGESELGSSLKIGYFAQAHEGLHADWTLMQEIESRAPKMLPGEIRSYLAVYLFTGDDVFRPVSSLSGGERGRLALACLALEGSNLLLLDEPTNHLDLPSQDILQEILSEFSGTILLVSHDRYLIDALATQIWDVLPDQHSMQIFKGSYSEYRASRQAETQDDKPVRNKKPKSKEHAIDGLSKEERRKKNEKLKLLEEEIAQHERDLELIARQLEEIPKDSRRVYILAQELASVQRLLDQQLNEWEKLAKETE
jgi:ATP-binding cassette subfamily F protein 3